MSTPPTGGNTPPSPRSDLLIRGSRSSMRTSLGKSLITDTKKEPRQYTKEISYWNYIHPDVLLSLQTGREGLGLNHHDEHLFIIVHQVFELWFKQVLVELSWVRDALWSDLRLPNITVQQETLTPRGVIHRALLRLSRADKIMRIASVGFEAMETMHPSDFLEFRDYLSPASGFQSYQMRHIEILWGLRDEQRIGGSKHDYKTAFSNKDENKQFLLEEYKKEINMKEAVNFWLANTYSEIPNIEVFMEEYLTKKGALFQTEERELAAKEQMFRALPETLDAGAREKVKRVFDQLHASSPSDAPTLPATLLKDAVALCGFSTDDASLRNACYEAGILPPPKSGEAPSSIESGNAFTLSQLGVVANAVMKAEKQRLIDTITMRRAQAAHDWDYLQKFFASTEPVRTPSDYDPEDAGRLTLGKARSVALFLSVNCYHPDYLHHADLVRAVIDYEQAMLLWRQRHVRMVEKMIGRRTGTGGSTGVHYLEATCAYRVFDDLWHIRSVSVPRSSMTSTLEL